MTVLQELRNILDNNRNWSADFIFDKIDELIELEKQQIINAFECQDNNLYPYNENYESGEQYYNETFNILNK